MKLLYILGHWFRRRNHSKAFLVWSFCGSIVQWSGTICAKLVEGTIGESSAFGPVVQEDILLKEVS